MSIGLRQCGAGELSRAAADRPKKRPFGIAGESGTVDVCGQCLVEIVMAGHSVILAALLMQPYPEPSVLGKHVLDLHSQRGPNAGEAINHERNERTIAQSRRRRGVYAVEKPAGFCRLQYRGLS